MATEKTLLTIAAGGVCAIGYMAYRAWRETQEMKRADQFQSLLTLSFKLFPRTEKERIQRELQQFSSDLGTEYRITKESDLLYHSCKYVLNMFLDMRKHGATSLSELDTKIGQTVLNGTLIQEQDS